MENRSDDIAVLFKAMREKCDLPAVHHTRWYWARRRDEADVGRLPRYLDVNHRSKARRLQDAIGKLLNFVRRKRRP